MVLGYITNLCGGESGQITIIIYLLSLFDYKQVPIIMMVLIRIKMYGYAGTLRSNLMVQIIRNPLYTEGFPLS